MLKPLSLTACSLLLAGSAFAQGGLDDKFIDYSLRDLALPTEAGQSFEVHHGHVQAL